MGNFQVKRYIFPNESGFVPVLKAGSACFLFRTNVFPTGTTFRVRRFSLREGPTFPATDATIFYNTEILDTNIDVSVLNDSFVLNPGEVLEANFDAVSKPCDIFVSGNGFPGYIFAQDAANPLHSTQAINSSTEGYGTQSIDAFELKQTENGRFRFFEEPVGKLVNIVYNQSGLEADIAFPSNPFQFVIVDRIIDDFADLIRERGNLLNLDDEEAYLLAVDSGDREFEQLFIPSTLGKAGLCVYVVDGNGVFHVCELSYAASTNTLTIEASNIDPNAQGGFAGYSGPQLINDTLGTATQLPIFFPVSELTLTTFDNATDGYTIAPVGDVDYYRLNYSENLSPGSKVLIRRIAGNAIVQADLRDAGDNVVRTGTIMGNNIEIDLGGLASGFHWLRISSPGIIEYEFDVTRVPDLTAPGNDAATATGIGIATDGLTLTNISDGGWYRFIVDNPTAVGNKIVLTYPDPSNDVDFIVQVRVNGSNAFTNSYAGDTVNVQGRSEIDISDLPAGQYLLFINDAQSQGVAYDLTFELGAAQGTGYPTENTNDTIPTAESFPNLFPAGFFGLPPRALFGGGDIDYYEIPVVLEGPTPNTNKITVRYEESIATLLAELVTIAGTPVGSVTTATNEVRISTENITSGTYYLRVSSPGLGTNPFDVISYQVIFDWDQVNDNIDVDGNQGNVFDPVNDAINIGVLNEIELFQLNGVLLGTDDEDFYLITLSEDGTTFSGIFGGTLSSDDFGLELLASDGVTNVLGPTVESNTPSLDLSGVPTGNYIIRVFNTAFVGSSNEYRLNFVGSDGSGYPNGNQNDTLYTLQPALATGVPAVVSGGLNYPGDRDRYEFPYSGNTDTGTQVAITYLLGDLQTDSRVRLEIRNSSNSLLFEGVDDPPTGNFIADLSGIVGGADSFRVSVDLENGGSLSNYDLTATFVEGAPPYGGTEENNTFATASSNDINQGAVAFTIDNAEPFRAYFPDVTPEENNAINLSTLPNTGNYSLYEGDTDIYAFTYGSTDTFYFLNDVAPAALSIVLNTVNASSGNILFELLAADETTVISSDTTGPAGTTATVTFAGTEDSGLFYLRVSSPDNDLFDYVINFSAIDGVTTGTGRADFFDDDPRISYNTGGRNAMDTVTWSSNNNFGPRAFAEFTYAGDADEWRIQYEGSESGTGLRVTGVPTAQFSVVRPNNSTGLTVEFYEDDTAVSPFNTVVIAPADPLTTDISLNNATFAPWNDKPFARVRLLNDGTTAQWQYEIQLRIGRSGVTFDRPLEIFSFEGNYESFNQVFPLDLFNGTDHVQVVEYSAGDSFLFTTTGQARFTFNNADGPFLVEFYNESTASNTDTPVVSQQITTSGTIVDITGLTDGPDRFVVRYTNQGTNPDRTIDVDFNIFVPTGYT